MKIIICVIVCEKVKFTFFKINQMEIELFKFDLFYFFLVRLFKEDYFTNKVRRKMKKE